jgi:thioredoxin reductase
MSQPAQTKEVVIIGAGPYGLSTAAHLRSVGIKPYVIGHPMAFWKQQMPAKMLLRSKIEASNIDAPEEYLSLEGYQRATGRKLPEPLPIEDFIAYGDWFCKQVVQEIDTRQVLNLSRRENDFEIKLEDSEKIYAKCVVLALGIGPFLVRPEEFSEIQKELAPHTSDLNDLTQFNGKRVAVIGKGQSALEYAALLHENNAEVTILTRSEKLTFRPFAWRKHLFRTLTPGPLRPFSFSVFPPTDLGTIKTARKMADPEKFRRQSPQVQAQLLRDCAKPVGAYWLQPRLQGVGLKTQVVVKNAEVNGAGLKLTLSDDTTDKVDRVVLATGYKIDIKKYEILDAPLKQRIKMTPDGYPVLAMSLQTSVDGLYMAGVIAEKTLGPTLRFVTGTSNAGPRLAASIADRLRLS